MAKKNSRLGNPAASGKKAGGPANSTSGSRKGGSTGGLNEKPRRSYPWLLPALIAAAAVVVIAAVVYTIATGQRFF